MNDPVMNDLDYMFDKEEYAAYLAGVEEDNNSPKNAVEDLLNQMFRGQNQSYEKIVQSLKNLADHYGLGNDVDFDESELQVTFEKDVAKQVEQRVGFRKEDQKRMLKWVKNVEDEIYGEDSIDQYSLDGSLRSLAWMLGSDRPSNRYLTIRRK